MGADIQSKIKTIKDEDGCTYSGEVKDGLADGNGWVKCYSTAYHGEWKKGKFHGKGRYTWENGEYEGDF